jgi:hypothetical protein
MRIVARVLACAVAAVLLLPAAAGAAQPGAIPEPLDFGPFTVDGLCSFPVTLTFSGKTGVLELPGDRVLETSPGLTGIYTNAADPSRTVTLNVTGTVIDQPSGLRTFNGRSVLATPEGLVLIIGTFTVSHENGLDVILSGNGTRTPVCPMIG